MRYARKRELLARFQFASEHAEADGLKFQHWLVCGRRREEGGAVYETERARSIRPRTDCTHGTSTKILGKRTAFNVEQEIAAELGAGGALTGRLATIR